MGTTLAICLALGLGLMGSGLSQRRKRHLYALEKRLGHLNSHKAITSNKLISMLHPVLAGQMLNPWGTDVEVEKQLKYSGDMQSLAQFRQSQTATLFSCLIGVTVWQIMRMLTHQTFSTMLVLTLFLTSVPLSGYLKFSLLKDQAAKRANQINHEIAAMFDLVAFSISAGDPVVSAIGRVGKICTGPTSQIFRQISAEITNGATTNQALSSAEKMTSANSFGRSLRAIKTSIERGTPIASVLRAQAGDARSNSAAEQMQLAGKKESLMMVPVVFLILPMIVFIALYPGLSALQFA